MTKERELLIELSTKDMVSYYYPELINRIIELLAQPEPENLTLRQGLAEYKKGYEKAELDLKREPLSDEEVFSLYENAEYLGFLAYRKGIKDAEKAHRIGVNNE